jgi:O-antigen ligase
VSTRWASIPIGFAALSGAALVISLGTMAPETLLSRWAVLLPIAIFGVAGWFLLLVDPRRLEASAVAALVLVLGAMELSTIASDGGAVSAAATWRSVLIAGTSFAAWYLQTDARGRRLLLTGITGFVHVLIAFYLIRVVSMWWDWLSMGYALSTLPIRAGLVGGFAPSGMDLGDFLLVLAPLAVLHLWRMGGGGRFAAAATAVLAILCLLIIGSRAIWLACSLTCAAVFLASPVGRNVRSVRRRAFAAALSILVIAVALAATLRVARDVDEGRMSAFSSSVRMASESPFFGVGPGRFPLDRLAHDVMDFDHLVLPSALNPILTMAAEAGLAGLIAGIVALVLIGRAAFKAWRREGADRGLMVAAFVGLAAVTIHAQVDAVFDVPSIALASLIVAGFLLPASQPGAAEHRSPRPVRWLALAGLALALPGLTGFLATERAAFTVTQGTIALAREDVTVALHEATDASATSPGFAPASHLSMLAFDASGALDDAIATARRLIAVEDLPQHHLRLAILLERAGRIGEARSVFEQTADREPSDPLISLNAAAFEARYGRGDLARRYLAAAFVADARLAHVTLPAPLDAVRDGAITDAADILSADPDPLGVARAVSLLVWAGRTQSAEALLTDVRPANADLLRAVVQASGGDHDASSRLRALVMSSPDERSVRWAWMASVSSCDLDQWQLWSRSYVILTGIRLQVPTRIAVTPTTRADHQPSRYPRVIWGIAPVTPGDVVGTTTWDATAGFPCDQ